MIKCIFLAAFSLLLAANIHAQDENEIQKGYDPTNLFTGGSISIGVGGSSFNAGIHPHIGYTLAKWIDVGGVVNFEYQSVRDQFNNKYRLSVYGLGAFTRIYPVQFIFIQAQPEFNIINQRTIVYNAGTSLRENRNAPSILVGGGYTTSRSDKNSFTYLSILVDVLKDKNSPYIDGYANLLPIIRAGINIGLNRGKRK